MKKNIKLLVIMLATFISITSVKAEIDEGTNYIFPIENRLNQKPNENAINYIYSEVITEYQNKDYIILYKPFNTSDIFINFFEKNNDDYLEIYGNNVPQLTYHFKSNYTQCVISNNNEHSKSCNNYEGSLTNNMDLLRSRAPGDGNIYNWYGYYDSNIDIKSTINFEMEDFYTDNIIIEKNKNLPKLKDLYEYNSWSEYEQEHLEDYTEVNLDNYKYVLLTLKDYNKKDAFTTNLQVKGQVGITPIYNYGQTSKDAITGVQVQDRCNANYENYTSYPLYILKQDLQNNAIYAVKECSENSSFKYDNTIFNIFYVTQENEDDPTVTINGQTYHTIPFEDLPSTANKNEEENYIPGQSGSINDTGGLDGAIKGIQQKMSEIWDTITYFTQFIGMIFSVFPEEIRIILLSSFTIAITIGLIKIFIK